MLQVREATAADLSSVLDLYKHLHANDIVATEEEVADAWDEIVSSSSVLVLVGEIGSQMVASCTVAIVPNLTRGARPYAVIENVVTHVEHRRKGFGSQIMRHALARAYERRCYKVMLLTGSKREETLRFYENVGFERDVKTGFVAYSEDRIRRLLRSGTDSSLTTRSPSS